MHRADLEFLTSPSGQHWLDWLAAQDTADPHTLPLLTRLRRDLPPESAAAALETARLRRRATEKFGSDAARLFFTRDALEQASHPAVRAYRAARIGPAAVIDAGCGIGADSLALSTAGADVLGLDIDPLRVAIARLNAAALGLPARFEVADIRDGLPPAEVVFFDPPRRDAEGRRIHHVEHTQPPLSIIHGWPHPRVIVKLSPGLDRAQLGPYPGLIEFISVDGDLKESLLWRGESPGVLRATLLTGSPALHLEGAADGSDQPDVPLDSPRAYLAEPDAAAIRAGQVQRLAADLDGALLDPTIAYFTTHHPTPTPWARFWPILDWLPFNLKKLRALLRQHGVGQVTVKKRGSPLTPETLIPQLKLSGSESRTLVLTRLRGQPIVLLCAEQPLTP
ncbi:MAG: methyltransferase domain-containing protein [Anaerolineae bacterium]|nr:methyltransferase domain-containing protein [Anaerolineae bacterium]